MGGFEIGQQQKKAELISGRHLTPLEETVLTGNTVLLTGNKTAHQKTCDHHIYYILCRSKGLNYHRLKVLLLKHYVSYKLLLIGIF